MDAGHFPNLRLDLRVNLGRYRREVRVLRVHPVARVEQSLHVLNEDPQRIGVDYFSAHCAGSSGQTSSGISAAAGWPAFSLAWSASIAFKLSQMNFAHSTAGLRLLKSLALCTPNLPRTWRKLDSPASGPRTSRQRW